MNMSSNREFQRKLKKEKKYEHAIVLDGHLEYSFYLQR